MLKKLICLPLLIVAISMLSACSGSDKIFRSKTPPDWAVGESKKYPNSQYVAATGSAADAESAKDRAMGNLSKIFESDIVDSTTATSNVQTSTTASGEAVNNQQRLTQKTNVHSQLVLEGIQVVEQWQNTGDLTYYALAVIHREQVGRILTDKMKVLDKSTAFELNAIELQENNLKRISAYQRVINLQQSRNSFQKTLKVIDLKGIGLKPKWSLVELKALSTSALSEVRLSAEVGLEDSNDGAELGLKSLLQAAMSQAGFSAVNVGDEDYILLAEIELQDTEEKQGWYWLRGSLQIRLINAENGVTLGSHPWELKASATQQSLVLSRFKQTVDNTLKKELKSVLISIAEEN